MLKINPVKPLMVMVFILSIHLVPASRIPPTAAADGKTQKAIIDWVCEALKSHYVFPEKAKKMAEFIHRRFKANRYSQYNRKREFTTVLTKDLRSISKDHHLRIAFSTNLPPPDDSSEADKEKARQQRLERDREQNFYFKTVRYLGDRIGYLRFDKFVEPKVAGPTAAAALNYLAPCTALIIDLRYNGGGSPDMVTFLMSYFFDKPVHFNSFFDRTKNQTRQEWTYVHVNGPNLADVDLYVLMSRDYSFSAAEGFAFALKNLNRATIVGETTSGGAHDCDWFFLRNHSIALKVPVRRAYSPKTGLNWEGTGVEPDVKVAAKNALDTARNLALRTFIKRQESKNRQADAAATPEPKDMGIEFVFVKGGTFDMGDVFGGGNKNEGPVHPVTLDDFYISDREITFAQYDRFCQATGREKPADEGWGRGSRPVINVSWKDARDFCVWVSIKTGQEVRLPTEAEWEYAARDGGKKVRFGNGRLVADPQEVNFNGDRRYKKPFSTAGINRQKTVPVGSFKPNGLGIYDMAGNVMEWCSDWFDKDYYRTSPLRNPRGPESSAYYRIIKGGAWDCSATYLRCSYRGLSTPDGRYNCVGFRILKVPAREGKQP